MSDVKALKAEIRDAFCSIFNCDEDALRVDNDGTVHVQHRAYWLPLDYRIDAAEIASIGADLERAAKAIRELRALRVAQ